MIINEDSTYFNHIKYFFKRINWVEIKITKKKTLPRLFHVDAQFPMQQFLTECQEMNCRNFTVNHLTFDIPIEIEAMFSFEKNSLWKMIIFVENNS